jgi:hypothetical protein
MNILYVLYEDFQNTYQYSIDKLMGAGHVVEIVSIPPPLWEGNRKIRDQYDIIQKNRGAYFGKKYDLAIWAIHETSSLIQSYQQSLTVKYGHLSVEHDIFSSSPQITIGSKSAGTFVFQKRHLEWLKKNKPKERIIESKWYKTEMPLKDIDTSLYSPWEDLGYVGVVNRKIALSYQMGKPLPIEEGLFRKQWYKTWLRPDYLKKGTTLLEDPVFLDAQGGMYLNKVSKFWVIGVSSTYLDALLQGCIPLIQITDKISMNEKIDETFNMVRVSGTAPFKAIVVDNKLAPKIRKMREDQNYFNYVLTELKNEWFQKNYNSLPGFSDALLNFINKL